MRRGRGTVLTLCLTVFAVLMLTSCTPKKAKSVYTVKFESVGGTEVFPQSVEEGKKAVEPKSPTKKDYTFDQWYLGEEAFNFNTEITQNITLVAKWDEIEMEISEYTVTFSGDGISTVLQVVQKGKPAVKPENPIQSNHVFSGWYLGDVAYDFSKPVVNNIELVAKWDLASYTVAFVGTGIDVDAQTVIWGQTANAPMEPQWEGHYFDAWYVNGEVFDFTSPIKENITLYAQWKRLVTVSFETGDANPVAAVTVKQGECIEAPIAPVWDAKHTFKAWQLNGTDFDFNQPIEDSITLKATWNTLVEITFMTGEGAPKLDPIYVAAGQKPTMPRPVWDDRHRFYNWFIDESYVSLFPTWTAVTKDMVAYAKWDSYYEVRYEAGGFANNPVASFVKEGMYINSAPKLTATSSQKLIGWYVDENFTTPFQFGYGGTAIKKDMVIYAKWGAPLNGAGTEANPYLLATEEDLFLASDFITAKNSEFYDAYYRLEQDIVLTKPWNPIMNFEGTFDGNGKTISGLYIVVNQGMPVGFFGTTCYATIYDLAVEGTIDSQIMTSDEIVMAGLLIGNAEGSEVRSCKVTGTIFVRGKAMVGGAIGRTTGTDVYAVEANVIIVGGSTIGGLVGSLFNSSTVVACYADVNLSTALRTASVGGLVGVKGATTAVWRSLVKGTISVSNKVEVGPIVGSVTLENEGDPDYVLQNYVLTLEIDGGVSNQLYSGQIQASDFANQLNWNNQDWDLTGVTPVLHFPSASDASSKVNFEIQNVTNEVIAYGSTLSAVKKKPSDLLDTKQKFIGYTIIDNGKAVPFYTNLPIYFDATIQPTYLDYTLETERLFTEWNRWYMIMKNGDEATLEMFINPLDGSHRATFILGSTRVDLLLQGVEMVSDFYQEILYGPYIDYYTVKLTFINAADETKKYYVCIDRVAIDAYVVAGVVKFETPETGSRLPHQMYPMVENMFGCWGNNNDTLIVDNMIDLMARYNGTTLNYEPIISFNIDAHPNGVIAIALRDSANKVIKILYFEDGKLCDENGNQFELDMSYLNGAWFGDMMNATYQVDTANKQITINGQTAIPYIIKSTSNGFVLSYQQTENGVAYTYDLLATLAGVNVFVDGNLRNQLVKNDLALYAGTWIADTNRLVVTQDSVQFRGETVTYVVKNGYFTFVANQKTYEVRMKLAETVLSVTVDGVETLYGTEALFTQFIGVWMIHSAVPSVIGANLYLSVDDAGVVQFDGVGEGYLGKLVITMDEETGMNVHLQFSINGKVYYLKSLTSAPFFMERAFFMVDAEKEVAASLNEAIVGFYYDAEKLTPFLEDLWMNFEFSTIFTDSQIILNVPSSKQGIYTYRYAVDLYFGDQTGAIFSLAALDDKGNIVFYYFINGLGELEYVGLEQGRAHPIQIKQSDFNLMVGNWLYNGGVGHDKESILLTKEGVLLINDILYNTGVRVGYASFGQPHLFVKFRAENYETEIAYVNGQLFLKGTHAHYFSKAELAVYEGYYAFANQVFITIEAGKIYFDDVEIIDYVLTTNQDNVSQIQFVQNEVTYILTLTVQPEGTVQAHIGTVTEIK